MQPGGCEGVEGEGGGWDCSCVIPVQVVGAPTEEEVEGHPCRERVGAWPYSLVRVSSLVSVAHEQSRHLLKLLYTHGSTADCPTPLWQWWQGWLYPVGGELVLQR